MLQTVRKVGKEWRARGDREGRTWQKQRFIVNSACERDNDWGFSASVVLADDTILTLSGCRGAGWPGREEANRKQPGRIRAIRWRLD